MGSPGPHTISFWSVDVAGNVEAVKSASFSIALAYQVAALYDQSKAHKAGSTVPIKMRVLDASGNELTSNDDAPAPGEGPTTESYIEYVFTKTGTYYLGVSGSPNGSYDPITGTGDAIGSSTGAYVLRITSPPAVK